MTDYDVLVVGSGIGGMQSAIDLADMGYRVLVVEKAPSIGGAMILLSKVFPTLDCASCISTPKMAATAHHPNVTVMTDSEVERLGRTPSGGFRALVRHEARFVDMAACTGCRLCEQACSVAVPDQFNGNLLSRRAAYLPFPQALPQKAVIDRAGTSPCTFSCPAGIKAHGYVSLARSGEYEKAFALVEEVTPLAGSLGRACYAPCETDCTRGELEGPLPIRRIKRFLADRHHATVEAAAPARPEPNGKRVAIVGSGPAGLTAAWQLARKGYATKIFEAAPEPGGALRLAIPSYRLPVEAVERDIAELTLLGVEIATDSRVGDLESLRADGFDAVLVATGTPQSVRLNVEGEELEGVSSALGFLRSVKLGEPPDLEGRTVVVVGGGNVAIDTARTARRLGAGAVHLVCLETVLEMPAFAWEIAEAVSEGVELHHGWGVSRIGGSTAAEGIDLKQCTAVFDDEGRFNPMFDPSVTDHLDCEVVIAAVGMNADTAAFPALAEEGARRIGADAVTFETPLPGVFAAGDAVTGPSTIADAVGQGRRAARMIDLYLRDEPLVAEPEPLAPVVQADVLARQRAHSFRAPLEALAEVSSRELGFAETEALLSEEEVLDEVSRCLDCGVCSECHECIAACPADAIRLDARSEAEDLEVGAVVVATGYELFDADLKPQYGYGHFANVVTASEMERLLAPTRPYNTVLRPGDGKIPERIAYVMCTGSRDETVGNPLCSKFCCMYSLKQNQLIMGVLPLADVTVHYIDIRAAGKGYDEFFEQAKAMGTTFVKGRVARISEKPDGDLVLRYEDMDRGGVIAEAEYDLVVLAAGVTPSTDAVSLLSSLGTVFDKEGYVSEVDEDLNPAATSTPGLFVAGSTSGPRDIPESVLHAGSAAVQAAAYVEGIRSAR